MKEMVREVIGVAGPAGAGKTSLVKALAERLGNAVAIYYDDYERATAEPMDRLMQWIEQGADVNDIRLPELVRDLAALKRGETATHPLTHAAILPGDHIVFETPFGKEHRQTAQYIDRLIWIDVPLDIALARKINEFTSTVLSRGNPDHLRDFITWLDTYLDNYLRGIHRLLQIQQERIRPNADIIIDGRNPFEAMVRESLSALRRGD